ncbi:hypothetical protein [Faecalicatena contorta]|uniref:hypothetical protein n=1 Tax=Faecalicatena contorta TaxID=39482 RepID=UPI001F19A23C|nr:hypothetical protein [Faecalicatena contorta]MCF2683895.1 sel1 repeat family protein [Faecalicatena contorta]
MFFVVKKCRIYAACGVSQTPNHFIQGVEAYHAGDYEMARQEWESSAAEGDCTAMFNLSVRYSNGEGVEKSREESAAHDGKGISAGRWSSL